MKRVLWTISGIFLTIVIIFTSTIATEKGEHMKILNLKTEIGEGNNKQIDLLFEGPRRKIVQITLRNNGVLESHKAVEPITIQCISGKGTLSVGNGKESLELISGVIVTIEPNTVHEIKSEPAVSVLLSKFTE